MRYAGGADRCAVRSPNSIVWSFDTYENAQSTGGTLVKQGFKSWFFITANYAFGQSLEELTSAVVKKGGGEVKGTGVIRSRIPQTSRHFDLKGAIEWRWRISLANAGLEQNCTWAGARVRHRQEHEDRTDVTVPVRCTPCPTFAAGIYGDGRSTGI